MLQIPEDGRKSGKFRANKPGSSLSRAIEKRAGRRSPPGSVWLRIAAGGWQIFVVGCRGAAEGASPVDRARTSVEGRDQPRCNGADDDRIDRGFVDVDIKSTRSRVVIDKASAESAAARRRIDSGFRDGH